MSNPGRLIILVIMSILFIIPLWGESGEVKILFTGNTHGTPLKFTDQNGKDQGGLAARKTLVDMLLEQTKRKDALVLDAGGFLGGRPESVYFDGKPDVTGMNMIGYDAAGVGITEIMDSFKAYTSMNKGAKFYLLNANVKVKNSYIGDTYMVKTINGVKIGLFSVLREDAGLVLSKTARGDFTIEDPIKRARESVQDLKDKEKVDVIIALTDLGYDEDDRFGASFLAQSVPGISIIIESGSGYNGRETFTKNNTSILTTGADGLYLGEINMKVENGAVTNVNVVYHAVNAREEGKLVETAVSEDEKTLAALTSLTKRLDKLQSAKIATLKRGTLSSKGKMSGLTSLCTLVTDSMAAGSNADIAMINAGMFAEADIKEGTVFTGETLNPVFKYNNTVVVMNIKGKDLINIVKFSMKRIGYGQFLIFSGMTVEYTPEDESVVISVGNMKIAEEKRYQVAVTSYLAAGGDGYEFFKDTPMQIDTHKTVGTMVNEYLAATKNIIENNDVHLIVK